MSSRERFSKGPNWSKIFSQQNWKNFLFWSLIMFLAGLTVRDVTDLIMEYVEDPKDTEFTIKFNNSMVLPNITFCMSKAQALSYFDLNTADDDDWNVVVQENLKNMSNRDSFLNNDWDYRIIVEAYEVIATLNTMERETTVHGLIKTITNFKNSHVLQAKRNLISMYLNEIRKREITFAELTRKVGIEVLKRAIKQFARETHDETESIQTKLHVSWISQMQLCFQPEYDLDNYKPIVEQGKFFTLTLSHNVDNLANQSVDCMSVDFHGRPSSLSRFLQRKGQVINGYNDDLCLGSRHEVHAEVRAKYTMLENDLEGTECRQPASNHETDFSCRSRCRNDLIQQMCHCTALSTSYLVESDVDFNKYPLCDYSKCEIDMQHGTFDEHECSNMCFRDCSQVRYEIEHVSAGRMLRNDLTLITLNWKSFEYLNMEQKHKYTITTFISALGGSIGVWLGLSVLSVFQGLTFLYSILSENVTKNLSRTNSKIIVSPPSPRPSIIPKKLSANPIPNRKEFVTNLFTSFHAEEDQNVDGASNKKQNANSTNGDHLPY